MLKVESDEQLSALLRARGQRVTSQRLLIHRMLRRQDRHMTAEDVREAVIDDLPGTSAPTVYATLDLLADLGLVRCLHVGSGPALYDSRPDEHHHTVCRDCGRVDDLDGSADLSALVAAARGADFDPGQIDVILSGLCRGCSSLRRAAAGAPQAA
ncbi:MAG: Fur family transcriptional regulator [Solirubrobacteraceae bacterium]